MDFRGEVCRWPFYGDPVDEFSGTCTEDFQEGAPNVPGGEPSMNRVRNASHSMLSQPTCIDPKLTMLWPSPPVSSSVDGALNAIKESASWKQDCVDTHVPEQTLATAGGETRFSRLNNPSNRPSSSREHRKAKTTVIQGTQFTTRAAARKFRVIDKDPDKTNTKWKCRTKGNLTPSGSSTHKSQMGAYLDPIPISKREGWEKEGIERIHTKLWRCRIGGCNKTFHRKGDAIRHVETTAKHNGKAVVCNCGAPFSRHDALKRHQRLCSIQT